MPSNHSSFSNPADHRSDLQARAQRLGRYFLPVYLLALLLIALVTISAYFGSYALSSVQERSANALALSGRERALAQRIALASLRLAESGPSEDGTRARQSLGEAIEQLSATLAQLLQGEFQLAFLQWPPLALKRDYMLPLDEQVRAFISRAQTVRDTPVGQLSANSAAVRDVIASADDALPARLDALVQQLEAEHTAAVSRLQQLELAAMGVILLTLAAITLYIFRPILRHAEHGTRRLVNSQQLLDAVLNTVGEAIVTVDMHNVIVRANEEVEKIWGYTHEELIGQKFQRLLSPRYRDSHHDASDIRHLGKRITIEGLKKDGRVFPLEIRITKTMTDGTVLFTSAMRDVTEARLAADQIRHQLETIQALYDSSQKLSQSLDLGSLAADITRTCVEDFGASLAWLGRAEADGYVRPFAQYPPDTRFPQQISVRWDDPDDPEAQGPSGRSIRARAPIITEDIATDSNFLPWREAALDEGFRCAAAFPLISGDRPFGALQLHSDQSGFFTPARVEFFQSFAHQAAAALENARLYADDRRSLERMQALRAVEMAITSSLDLRVILNVLLDQVVTQLHADAADVLLVNPHSQTLEHAADRGFRHPHVRRSRLRLGKGHAGYAALERTIIRIPNLSAEEDDPARAALLAGEGFTAYYAVPLIVKGQVKGVLEIFHRTPLEPDFEWLSFLEALAAQAAIAIDNATLFESLERSNVELMLAYDDTLEGWSTALDLRDRETEGHTVRVTALAVRLAQAMGLSDGDVVQIHRGGLLHDIGKMGIPDHILLKTGPLTEDEWAIMRMHPLYAYEMLSRIAFLRPALDIPYCHHEKWDGTGYPQGLKGEQIPLAARIFAVADVWDALTTDRPYRKAWPHDRACEYVRALAGTHFDPRVVDCFLEMLESGDGDDLATFDAPLAQLPLKD